MPQVLTRKDFPDTFFQRVIYAALLALPSELAAKEEGNAFADSDELKAHLTGLGFSEKLAESVVVDGGKLDIGDDERTALLASRQATIDTAFFSDDDLYSPDPCPRDPDIPMLVAAARQLDEAYAAEHANHALANSANA